MNKMRLLIIFLLPLFFLGINGCTPSDNSGDEGNQKLGFIDIKDAAYLYIDSPNAKSKSGEGNTLLKITEDGTVKEVTYRDGEGNEYTNTAKPTNIINVSDNYVIIVFDYENYLVRKSDGSVYLLPIQEKEGYSYIYSAITMDSKENMYFIVYNNQRGQKTIVKVNVSDPKNLTYEKLTPTHHNPENFIIDKDDNLFYSEKTMPIGYSDSRDVYVLSKGAVYKTVSYPYWKGIDGYGYIYVDNFINAPEFEYDPSKEPGRYVYKVIVTKTGLTYELFLFDNGDYWNAFNGRKYYIGNKLYLIEFRYEYKAQCKVFDITNKEDLSSTIYSCPESFSPDYIDSKYVYSTPKDGDFYRFNPVNGDLKKLYIHNNDYEIYGDIKVNNGIITFTAFQLSRNKNFMIEINGFDGGMKTTELQSVNKCVILEKIN